MSGEVTVTPGYEFDEVTGEILTLEKLNRMLRDLMARIDAGAITTRELKDGAITADKLAVEISQQLGIPDGSVTTLKLANEAVTETKLGAAAVTAVKIAAGAATADKLGAGAVTAVKIAAGAVTATKLGAGAVDSAALAALAVTEAKIAAGAVTATKLGAGLAVQPGDIIAFGGAVCPTGYLVCDGASKLRGDYPALFAALGSGAVWGVADATHFYLPQLCGTFLRGRDGGAGIDPDRATRHSYHGGASGDNVGSYQYDGLKAHTHSYNYYTLAYGYMESGSYPEPTGVASLASGSNGGNETRPVNAAVLFCIKT